jgi:fatty acid desaturase
MKTTHFNKRDNLKATLDLIFRVFYHFSLITISFILYNEGYLFLAIIFAIPHWMTFSFFGSAGLSHELFHNSVFSNFKLNQLLYKLFMILTWENYNYFKSTHWIHHKITLDENDPKSLFKSKISYIYLFQLFTFDFKGFTAKIRYTIQNGLGIIPNKRVIHLFQKGSKELKNVRIASQIIILFHSFTILLFIFFKIYFLIFLVNLAPFFVSFFNRLLGFSQHYGLNSRDNKNYFENCRTVILPKFWSFFYCNMNYHIEHHLYPNIPYYRLNEVHTHLKETNTYNNLSYGWKSLIKELKILGIFNF